MTYAHIIAAAIVAGWLLQGCGGDAEAVDGDITVSWDANPPAQNVTEYVLNRDGAYFMTTTNAPDANNRVGVTFREYPGRHCFNVQAVNAWGTSPVSESACVDDAPSQVQGVRVQ